MLSQSTSGGGGGSVGRKTSSLRPPEQTLKCPRCDSPNTKFCYYNNYSLTQPRHFCKACRRYWTNGGALRNIPIGGSCKKNKKTKYCTSRFFVGEPSYKGSSSDLGGMKVFGLSAVGSELGGLNFPPKNTTSNPSFVNIDPLVFPFSSSHFVMKQGDQYQYHQEPRNQSGGMLANIHEIMGRNNNHLHNHKTDLASSIESLSSINQDLHWKLQQQRLALLLGGGGENDLQHQKKQGFLESQVQKVEPILFQNLETSKPADSSMDGHSSGNNVGGGSGGGLATEWFFEDSYAPANLNQGTDPNNSNRTGNDQSGSMKKWNEIQDWNHLKQYSSIP